MGVYERRLGRRGYRLQVTVRSADVDVVRTFWDRFGGTLYTAEQRGLGTKELTVWSVTATGAQTALRAMLPYLRAKHGQAAVALTLAILPRAHHPTEGETTTRAGIAAELRRLKGAGPHRRV